MNNTCCVRTQDWCQIIWQVHLSSWVYVINKLRSVNWRQRVLLVFYNHGRKSWDTFAFLWGFPIHTGPTPPLTAQTMSEACIHYFFFLIFNFVLGGLRENCRKISRGNREMTENCEYCNTVPRTFVQDCRLSSTPKWKNSICLQCREHNYWQSRQAKKLFDDTHDLRDSCAEIVYFSKIICCNCVDKSITLLKKVDLPNKSIIDTQVFFKRERGETVTKKGGLSSKVGEMKKSSASSKNKINELGPADKTLWETITFTDKRKLLLVTDVQEALRGKIKKPKTLI